MKHIIGLLLAFLLILPNMIHVVVSMPAVVVSSIGKYMLMELNATDITTALNDAADILFTAVKLSMYMIPLVLVFRVYSRLWR